MQRQARVRIHHSRRGGATREHMRIRRRLFELVLEIIERDHRSAEDVAHMCGTSRARAASLRRGEIEKFNSESLIGILLRMGLVLDIHVKEERAYRRWEFPSPRAESRFIEPWRA